MGEESAEIHTLLHFLAGSFVLFLSLTHLIFIYNHFNILTRFCPVF